MTPTLNGRWQTRIGLLLTLGVLVSLPFWLIANSTVFFVVLGYVIGFGLVWDILYTFLQSFRWERDWPAAFAVAFAIIEAGLIYVLARTIGLPGLPADLNLGLFAFHYACVWVVTFLFAQGPMRVIFPWWRFHGGRIFPAVARSQRR